MTFLNTMAGGNICGTLRNTVSILLPQVYIHSSATIAQVQEAASPARAYYEQLGIAA